MKNKTIKLRDFNYEIIRNDNECFNQAEVNERVKDTDYFDEFDYIMGDIAYEKVRLKGYYDSKNKKKTIINDYSTIDNYIKNYCQEGSDIFILKKIK